MKVDRQSSLQGAAHYGLDLDTLRFLGGEDGDVYEGVDATGPFIFKLVPVTEGQVPRLLDKLAFARYLGEHGVRVALPLPSPQGAWVEVLQRGEAMVAATKVAKVPGRHPSTSDPREWNTALFSKWGRVVGRMHALAQRYEGGADIGDWEGELISMVDWCHDPEVKVRWERMHDHLASLPRPPDAYGLIHNDLHMFNFMVHLGEIYVFDFDVCNHHWFMTDIGIAVFHALWAEEGGRSMSRKDFARGFLDSFMEGYEQENHLDEVWLRELPTFLKYRQLLLHTVFADSWGGADGQAWQRRWVRDTRERIVRDEPVADL